jgi:hypothetical protein
MVSLPGSTATCFVSSLLVDGGQLCGVIDFGSAGIGERAADVVAAWSVFGPAGRDTFRGALAVDEETWNRARGYALHQAALIIPYYRRPTPGSPLSPPAPSRKCSANSRCHGRAQPADG